MIPALGNCYSWEKPCNVPLDNPCLPEQGSAPGCGCGAADSATWFWVAVAVAGVVVAYQAGKRKR